MAEILWTEEALRDLEKLDKVIARRIIRKIDWANQNFEKIVPEALSGDFKGTYKLRIGDWRALYTLEKKTMVIQFVGHRRNIYKH